MSDRLSQLQDTVNLQAEHFCNSIGCLQEQSRPSKFPGFERIGTQSQNECEVDKYPEHFAQEISVCAKKIDSLIESLPNEENTQEIQAQSLRRLEIENQEGAKQLQDAVDRGQQLLEKIQAVLSDIAQAQLDMEYNLDDFDVHTM